MRHASNRRASAWWLWAAGLLAAASPALALNATSPAAPAAPAAPATAASAAARIALCDSCGTVASVVTEQRKGEAGALGTVGGAVVGGVLGHQVGGGTGKTVATVGGAVAGGLIGRELERRAKRHTVWITTVTMKDGSARRFEAGNDPGLHAGDIVSVDTAGQMRLVIRAAPPAAK